MDWSLPKGKLEEGEGWQEAALREVEEETGYRARALDELQRVAYLDRKARRKLVRYWLMEPIDGQFEPHGEVDEIRWVPVEEADRLLTYDHDKGIVRRGPAPPRGGVTSRPLRWTVEQRQVDQTSTEGAAP